MIYRDPLGCPQPVATVAVYGASYGEPRPGAYLQLTAVSNAPRKSWPYESKDVSAIVSELEAEGWKVSARVDGYDAPLLDLVHLATESEAIKETDPFREVHESGEDCFVRFGDLPPGGRSKNHADGTLEPGVSVFRARMLGNRVLVMAETPAQSAGVRSVFDRPLYRIDGEPVGTGADGEPCLRVKACALIEGACVGEASA